VITFLTVSTLARELGWCHQHCWMCGCHWSRNATL